MSADSAPENNYREKRMSTAVFEIGDSKTSPPVPPSGAPAETVLTQILLGRVASQALYAAAKLGIADLLAGFVDDIRGRYPSATPPGEIIDV